MKSAYARTKPLCTHERRLFSDIEASAVPGLQFCMAADIPEPRPCDVRIEFPASLQSVPASPLTCRGSALTGNVFVDYRRYSARRLLDVKELQRCREASALQTLAPTCRRSLLSCHTASVTRLSLDHTGRYLLSSSRDCSIALYDLDADSAWNLNGGFGPTPKTPPIGFVQRHPDRPPRRILHPVRFQSAASGPVSRSGCIKKNVAGRQTAGGSVSSAASEGPRRGHWHSVTSVEFMPEDSGLFVSSGLDKVFKVWDTRVWEPVLDIRVHSPLLCCAFNRTTCHQAGLLNFARASSLDPVDSPPAQLLVAGGSQDGTVRIFDLRCGVAQQSLTGHKGAVIAATWSSWSPYQFFSGSSDKSVSVCVGQPDPSRRQACSCPLRELLVPLRRSIRGWDLRRSDSWFVTFDKNKPDTAFIGERCSQSAAFRQLVRSTSFMGRERYPDPLPDVSAAAACAAFKDEPTTCLARFNSLSSTSHRASLNGRGDAATLFQVQEGQTTTCTLTSRVGIAAISAPTKHASLGLRAEGLASTEGPQAQGFVAEGKAGSEAHGGSESSAHACGERPQVHSELHNDPAGARPRANTSTKCSKGTDQDIGGRKMCKRQLSSPISGLQAKRSQTNVSSLSREPPAEASVFSRPAGVSRGSLRKNGTHELLVQYGQILRELEAKSRQKNRPTSVLEVQDGSHQNDASSRDLTQPCLERVQHIYPNCPSDHRRKRGIPIFKASGEVFRAPLRKQAHVEPPPRLRIHGPDKISDGLLLKGSNWSSFRESSPSGWSAPPDTSSSEGAHDGPVTCLMQTPDGRFLISSGGDGRIRLWNAANGCHCFIHMNLDMSTRYHHPQARSMQRSRSRNSQPSARSGEVAGSANSNSIEGKALWGKQAAMSSRGDYLIHGRGRLLCTYDIFTGTELQIVAPGHSQDVSCVAWNARRGELYSGASDGTLLVCDDAACYSVSEDEDDARSDDEDLGVVNILTRGYV